MEQLYKIILSVMIASATGFLSAGEKINQGIELTMGDQVHFINVRGKVKITGWEQSKINIEGTLDDEAKGLLVTSDKGKVKIIVDMPHHLSPASGSDLQLYIPMTSKVIAEGVSTEWQFDNLGKLFVHSVTGDVRVTNNHSDVVLEVVSADVVIDGVTGNAMVNGLSGKIELQKIIGEVVASTVEGKLHFVQPDIGLARLSSVNGEIEVDGTLKDEGMLVVNSVNGNVLLNVGSSNNFSCELNALHGGRIENKLAVAGKSESKQMGSSLSLAVGKGDARIEATTISGTIFIQK